MLRSLLLALGSISLAIGFVVTTQTDLALIDKFTALSVGFILIGCSFQLSFEKIISRLPPPLPPPKTTKSPKN